ncbi:hypothetical protein [Thiothrix nivea]|uniref:Cytochrome c domain-containing protein n=1 Tax=Thiothrix nivea (strain ATCC 35100 / DSM 5205 / JP2) TaxID=870187 RepID=A0A656HK34_THINJ|nr:hypothetical protein [Thiothrix nivea]EIJ36454.1 hypothetical protein Thini_3954 [Thiothrix nivea DSM 5205]
MNSPTQTRYPRIGSVSILLAAALAGCNDNDGPATSSTDTSTPTATTEDTLKLGKSVFSFETFGNERFWTDAMRLPQGLAQAQVTPLDALSLGLNVNVEALSPGTAKALLDALEQVKAGTPPKDTVLGNPAVTLALINEGAVIGVVPFDAEGNRKPLGSDASFKSDSVFNPLVGDRMGVSCSLCHAATDNSIVPAGFAGPGSVGKQKDGVIAENLDIGSIFAAADNPLAYLPFLQLSYDALGNATLGRNDSTEGIKSTDSIADQTAAARRYLTGTNTHGLRHYPVTSFDATPDGIGNATYIPPFFRTDLSAPWGGSGAFEKLDDFNNLVYTVALDPTSLLTTEGRGFLNFLAGPVGDEIANRYESVLRATNVIPDAISSDNITPFVQASTTGIAVGSPTGPVGRRVDDTKLQALHAYTDQLKSPAAPDGLNPEKVALGEQIFMLPRTAGGANCIACHTAPDKPVENFVRPMEQLYRPYSNNLLTLLDRSDKGITNIQKTLAGPATDYDLSVVVLDASIRGEPKDAPGNKPGYAKPLLLGLDAKDEFLHDGSVAGKDAAEGLGKLLDPARGADAPHPFYFPGLSAMAEPQLGPYLGGGDGSLGREALTEYLRSRTAD